MSAYREFPPEPDWEGSMERHCEADVTRKIVTPDMEKLLKELQDGRNGFDTGWYNALSDEEKAKADHRWLSGRVNMLVLAWRAGEEIDFVCTFDGEADAAIENGRVFWTCPVCGHEHDDEAAPEGPDPDDWRDEQLERQAEEVLMGEPE